MKSNSLNKNYLLLFTFVLLTLVFVQAAPAAARTILLAPFTVNVSPEYSQTANSFDDLLRASLQRQGFTVKTTSTKPQSTQSAQALAYTNNADAILYGNFSQIGSSFSVNMSYVNTAGNVMPINTDLPVGSSMQPLADQIAYEATQTTSIDPIISGGISDVRVEGTRALDPEVVLARMNLTRGSVPTTELVDEDIRRIWATGYFNDVQARMIEENGEDILLVTVEERPRIEEVVVNGSRAVRLSEILETMTTSTGDVLNDRVLADDIQRVTELYRKDGFYNAQVDYEVIERANGTAALAFNVVEGNKLYVRDIVFDGLENIDQEELKKYLLIKERGFWSFLTGSGVLEEENLERDAQTVAAYAVNEGYINAQVASPEVTYNEDGITITYIIDEGARYALGDITFTGELLEDPAVYYDMIALDEWREENTYFSLETMQNDIRTLTLHYNNEGYAFAQILPQDSVDNEAKTISIAFHMVQNGKVHINRVDAVGNYRTRDNVILREMRLADGDEFSSADILRSQERLMRTQYFETVDIEVIPTENPALVDLAVNVEEASTGTIMGGVGYSTYDGFGVSAAISQNNLFGRGYSVGVDGYVSEKEMNMTGHFFNPRIYDTNLGAGITLYGITQEWIDYDRDSIGMNVNFAYPLGEYTMLSWGYRLERYELYNMVANASASIREYAGINWASVVNFEIERDTTNDLFFPTRGTKTILSMSYGGDFLGGDDNFIRAMLEFGAYYELFENHVIHGRVSVGGVFENTSHIVPAFERFYIGGMNSIRGYQYEDISPYDFSTGESIGADRVAYASLEYVWMFQEELGLAVAPFFDIAVATDSRYNDFFDKLYYSAGVELRWRSPMGDLRFAYGFPLTENVWGEDRSSGRMEFTIGQAF